MGGNVNEFTGSGGFTPLIQACQNGFLDIVTFLVESGADVNLADQSMGSTPLAQASYTGQTKIVEYLLLHVRIIYIFHGIFVKCIYCFDFSNQLELKILCMSYVCIVTVLIFFSFVYRMCKYAQGAHARTAIASTGPGQQGMVGTTPLHMAAQEGHLAVVEMLLGANADVNAIITDER